MDFAVACIGHIIGEQFNVMFVEVRSDDMPCIKILFLRCAATVMSYKRTYKIGCSTKIWTKAVFEKLYE